MGSLWGILLTPIEIIVLSGIANRIDARDYLINKLYELEINYDDIIQSLQRKLVPLKPNNNIGYSYEDTALRNICIDENLIYNILRNKSAQILLFTNGATFRTNGLQLYVNRVNNGKVKINNNDALSLFLRGCQELGLELEMQCLPFFNWTPIHLLMPNNRSTKVIFEVRIRNSRRNHNFTYADFEEKTFTIITPFSPAAHGTIEHHPVITNYRILHPNIPILQILKEIYGAFRNNNLPFLYSLNV